MSIRTVIAVVVMRMLPAIIAGVLLSFILEQGLGIDDMTAIILGGLLFILVFFFLNGQLHWPSKR